MASREYFSHDYNARSDSKLVRLAMEHGMEGIGIYWCIVEMLYESGGYIDLSECERIAFELRTDSERIASIVRSKAFCITGEKFYSDTILKRLEKRDEKSHKTSQSAYSRWHNNSKDDANAMRSHTERNAIKVKENKSKRKEKEEDTHARDPFFYLKEGVNSNQDLVKKWVYWVEFRRKMKRPYRTKEGETAAYNRLLKLSNSDSDIAIQIIDQSIVNEWQGLFPLKTEQNGKQAIGKQKSQARIDYEEKLIGKEHE
jgi:uncharacterized protein YdaU (DUF1376 family)